MFSGHHDTWYYGVMDNGGANATMLEVARLAARPSAAMAARAAPLLLVGPFAWPLFRLGLVRRHPLRELARRCVAHVNVDSAGGKGNTVLATRPRLLGAGRSRRAKRSARRAAGARRPAHERGPATSPSGASAFPRCSWAWASSRSAGDENVTGAVLGGCASRAAGYGWWWHTPRRPLDKMDRDAPGARHADLRARALAAHDRPVLPLDYAIYLDDLRAVIEALQSELGERGGLAPVVALVRRPERARRVVQQPQIGTQG